MKEKKMAHEELQFRSKVPSYTIAKAKGERICIIMLATLEKLAIALDVDVRKLFEYVRGNSVRYWLSKAAKNRDHSFTYDTA